jgi:hypothetical protein
MVFLGLVVLGLVVLGLVVLCMLVLGMVVLGMIALGIGSSRRSRCAKFLTRQRSLFEAYSFICLFDKK